ncbi:MAG: hypothetical protein AAFR88_02475 [Pseudomonadota bacterium]
MKTLLLALASTAMACALAAPEPALAESSHGPFDKLKKAAKKAEKTKDDAEDVVETVDTVTGGAVTGGAVTDGTGRRTAPRSSRKVVTGTTAGSNYPQTARAPGHAGVAGPTPAKYANATKCAALDLGNAFVARAGNYTFSQGISTEQRTGLLDRRPVEPVSGCVFEGLGIGDVLYVEFDKSKFKKYNYRIQCASYDGSEQQDNVFGPSIDNYGGKAIMLHTGNSTGYEPTASGSNSDRNNAYKKYMDGRGRAFATFNFKDRPDDKQGTDFYCQWFDRNTGESAIALTYRRGPTGS